MQLSSPNFKTFPMLYKKTSHGKIQTWQIHVDMCQDKHGYYTSEGLLDGKTTHSEMTICQGKNQGKANETTDLEQAMKEAAAKHDKQLKHGYCLDPNDVDTAKKYFQVMLAKKYNDHKDDISFPVLTDTKFNGGRCIAKADGLWTRKGEWVISCPHIEDDLKPLFKVYPDLVLDGEIYNYDLRQKLNELMSIFRTKDIDEDLLERSKQICQYHIYDAIGYRGVTVATKAIDRRNSSIKLIEDFRQQLHSYIQVHTGTLCYTEAAVMEIYNKLIADGEEGIIVRTNESYEQKRSKNLLKLKPEDDGEYLIIDVLEGTGNRAGAAGSILVRDQVTGAEFRAALKGELEQFQEVLKNKQNYIGKVATIKYFGLTGLGTPNYAQFDCNNWRAAQDK